MNVSIGKYVNPADVLLELVNTNDLHLSLTVFEKDLPSIKPGQMVKAYLTGDSTKSYDAKVILVSIEAFGQQQKCISPLSFYGPLPKLLPGMFMNAEIQLTSTSTVAVPEEAVVRSGDKNYVFIERRPGQFRYSCRYPSTQHGFIAINTVTNDLLNKVVIKKNAYTL